MLGALPKYWKKPVESELYQRQTAVYSSIFEVNHKQKQEDPCPSPDVNSPALTCPSPSKLSMQRY